MVQHATDLANPATFSAPMACIKGSFKLVGQALGATIYFRVLAIEPKLPAGQTEYSAWFAGTVSS